MLAVVLLVLGGLFVLDEYGTEKRTSTPALPGEPLLGFFPEEVEELVLISEGEVFRCHNTMGEWSVDERGAVPQRTVEHFLSVLQGTVEIMEVSAEPGQWADFGLDPPVREIRVQRKGRDAPEVLFLGKRNPAWTGVYSRRQDSPRVFLVGALLLTDMDHLLSIFRNLR